jgi:hypothetical protein
VLNKRGRRFQRRLVKIVGVLEVHDGFGHVGVVVGRNPGGEVDLQFVQPIGGGFHPFHFRAQGRFQLQHLVHGVVQPGQEGVDGGAVVVVERGFEVREDLESVFPIDENLLAGEVNIAVVSPGAMSRVMVPVSPW